MANLTGTDVSTLESPNAANVLRPTKMIVMIAPQGGTTITTIVDSTNGQTLTIPSDYVTVGYLEKADGLGLIPKLTTSPSEAYGETQPINYYITATEFTATFTMKETKKKVLETYNGLDLSTVTANGTTNEVTFDIPELPPVIYPRMLVVGQHQQGTSAVWVAHWMPKVMITDMAQQDWKDQNDLTYKVTYTALVDSTVGTSRRPFLSGPGMAALKAGMGF